jgi:threonine dehydrogenase-like Zn-dependent dehydrogenase
MKAIVNTEYGSPDILEFTEIAKPAPKDNEVLVKVLAASVNASDWHLLTADIFLVRLNMGLLKPKNTILGADIAGRVEAVGRNVKQFQPGDAVFGDAFAHGYGGFGEYVSLPAGALALKPANLSFEEAAAVPLAAKRVLWIKACPDFEMLFQLLNNLRVDDQRRFWFEYQEADENVCGILEDKGQMGVEVKTFAPVSHNALTRIEEYVQ